MLKLLGAPTWLVLLIVLAVLAYMIYRVVSLGRVQPLEIIVFLVLGFLLLRILYRFVSKPTVDEDSNN